jgi:hypothetical protein
MELQFELWDRIYEKCDLFQSRRKLYEALPTSYRAQYPKTFIKDGDKCLLKHLSIYDGINVTLSLKIGGYYSFDVSPIDHKNLKLQYKDIPKTLEELFDFDTNIYRYYNSILKYNLYKIEQGWKKNFILIDLEYQLKFLDNEYTIKKTILPVK